MKRLLIILTGMMTSFSMVSAASPADERNAFAVKSVNSMDKLAVFVKGAC